jgi:hypothetical protein
MWNEAVEVKLEVLSQHSPGGLGKQEEKSYVIVGVVAETQIWFLARAYDKRWATCVT